MKNMKRAISVFIMASMLLGLLPALMPIVPVHAAISKPAIWDDYAETTNLTDSTDPNAIVTVGQTIWVKGTGVTAGQPIYVYFDSVTAGGLLNTTTGLADGSYECEVDVPDATNYIQSFHYIWVKDGSSGLTERCGGYLRVNVTISLDPTSGLPDDTITISGTGFQSNKVIEVWFESTPRIEADDNVKTDSTGSFESTFKVPSATYGVHTVNCSAGDWWTTKSFTVGPAISLDVSEGPSGTVVKVSGRGFGSGATFKDSLKQTNITVDGTTNYTMRFKDSTDVTVGTDKKCTIYLVVPSVPKDSYKIRVRDSSGKYAYRSFEVTGTSKITISPGYGTPGAVVTIKGYNFTKVANTDVSIGLETATYTVKTTLAGEFTKDITLPPLGLGQRYDVWANDTKHCNATKKVLLTMILLQLSEASGPVGSKINLMGTGFNNEGNLGQFNATFGDMDLIGSTSIDPGKEYFSKYFYVPSAPSGVYTITVLDVLEDIEVTTEYTVTDQATLTPKKFQVANRYNLSIDGVNFAEEDDTTTEWYLYNSTHVWDITADVNGTGMTAPPKTDENGKFTAYFKIPWNLELGEYTINCTTETTVTGKTVEQYAETTIEVVPEELILTIGKGSYARGDTITFTIKASLEKPEFYLGIKDLSGNEMYNSSWLKTDWKGLGAWYYIPQTKQLDDATEDKYVLPSDAVPGTWSYAFWDLNSTILGSGTFEVTEKTEIEMLQESVSAVGTGLTNLSTTVTDLATTVGDVSDAIAGASTAADAAKAAADAAKAAADANTAAIGEVSDKADSAKAAADSAKAAADSAKTAADSGLEAANNAKTEATGAKAAAENAAEAATDAKTAASGLTTLVYGAIGASLVAALAAIVSLMQISRRIAG